MADTPATQATRTATPQPQAAQSQADGRRVQAFARLDRAEMAPDANPGVAAQHRRRRAEDTAPLFFPADPDA